MASYCNDGNVPGAVDAAHACVHDILEHLTDPIEPKHCEHEQADQLSSTARSSASDFTCWVVGIRCVFDVHGDESNREPSTNCQCHRSTDSRDHEDMTKISSHVDRGFEHEHGEWNPMAPTPEAEGVKDCKDEEYYAGRIIFTVQVVDGSSKAEKNTATLLVTIDPKLLSE